MSHVCGLHIVAIRNELDFCKSEEAGQARIHTASYSMSAGNTSTKLQ